jgi:hypothetical protein
LKSCYWAFAQFERQPQAVDDDDCFGVDFEVVPVFIG